MQYFYVHSINRVDQRQPPKTSETSRVSGFQVHLLQIERHTKEHAGGKHQTELHQNERRGEGFAERWLGRTLVRKATKPQ